MANKKIIDLTAKTTPADDDLLLMVDSEDANEEKKVKVSDLPSSGDDNVQSDWDAVNTADDDFILNKPTTITEAQSDAIAANTLKTGITTAQSSAITANTLKLTANTANVNTALGIDTSNGNPLLFLNETGDFTVPPGGVINVQADWDETNVNSDAFIANKPPTITTAQAAAITTNTAKTEFPGFGTTSTTALVGDTKAFTLGTSDLFSISKVATPVLALTNTTANDDFGELRFIYSSTNDRGSIAMDRNGGDYRMLFDIGENSNAFIINDDGSIRLGAGETFTNTDVVFINDITATATELNILDGATLTTQELNFVDGVTSLIQTQLDSKVDPNTGDFTSDVTITEEAPQIRLFNTREAGDDRELGGIRWNSDDDANVSRLYGRITFESADISSESLSSAFMIRGIRGGTFRDYLNIGPNSTAVGPNAFANGSSTAVAVGGGSNAAGSGSIAIGSNASATGLASVAIGIGASATFTNQIVLGTEDSYLSIPGYIISDQGAILRANSVLGTDADSSLTVNAGTINFANLPTASTGLDTGDLWNDSGTLKIV